MKRHKVVIQIFPMVTDIDFLERTLLLLKQASINVDKEKFHVIVDINLPISDYLTDWDNSIIKQDYFIKKFKNLEKYMDWCDEYDFSLDYEVKGILSEEDRWRHYGHWDHRRYYSKSGFVSKLTNCGFKVEQLGIDFFGKENFEKYSVVK